MNVALGVEGRVKLQVLTASGLVVEERPWQRNLILDQGMTGIETRSWANSFLYCCVGDQSTGAGGYAPDVTQTGLGHEVHRTNNYVFGAASTTGTVIAQNSNFYVINLARTFDFPIETGTATYTELGFSWSGTAGTNLFSRVAIAGAPIAVAAGQRLRVTYTIALKITPAASATAFAPNTTVAIAGFGGSAIGKMLWQGYCLDGVSSTTGLAAPLTGSGSCMEPSSALPVFEYFTGAVPVLQATGSWTGGVTNTDASFSSSAFNNSGGVWTKTMTKATPGVSGGLTINGLGILQGGEPFGTWIRSFQFNFNSPIVVPSGHTITWQIVLSWARS